MELAEPTPHASLDLQPLEELADLSCQECHATIAQEWATTQHAHAWKDEIYQEALKDKRRPQSCHGCHIPAPLHQGPPERFGNKPRPREDTVEARHLGVSCSSCHLGPEGVVLGPWGAATDAHTSEKNEHFIESGSNKLCVSCHRTTVGPVIGVAKDFQLARLGERGMSCVGCHMMPVERPAATDTDGAELPAREGRSHKLQTPRDPGFLARSFALSARSSDGATVLTIKNRAGHRVPGLVGRRLVFTVHGLDDTGAVVAEAEHTFDDVAYLGLEATLDVRLDAEATKLKVEALHHAPNFEEPIPFLEMEIEVP